MLCILIDEYQNRAPPLPKAELHRTLAYLLDERGMKLGELWAILPVSRVSEFLNGKRSSKLQPTQLAALLRVPVELFL